jgi:hypothetical protein
MTGVDRAMGSSLEREGMGEGRGEEQGARLECNWGALGRGRAAGGGAMGRDC